MFTARVEDPPVVDDLAGAAIRRGQAVRRRQVTGSAVAAVVAFAVVVGGMASIRQWWNSDSDGRSGSVASFNVDPADAAEQDGPAAFGDRADAAVAGSVEPPGPAAAGGIGLDLRVGDQLWTTDGRQLALTGVGPVTRTYSVPGGWVYAGADQIRFLRADGSSISLSGREDRWVLSPDGTDLAFVLNSKLFVARIGPAGLAVRSSTDVPPDTWPIGFFGARVVISVDNLGVGLVDPGQPYQPSWNTDLTAVLGARGDLLVGLVRRSGAAGYCLGDIRAAGAELRVERTGGCALDLAGGAPVGRLAPNAAWLAEQRGSGVALINVNRAMQDTAQVITCPVDITAGLAWVDAQTVVTGNGWQVVRCGIDGGRQVTPLPTGVSEDWQVVPRLFTESVPSR